MAETEYKGWNSCSKCGRRTTSDVCQACRTYYGRKRIRLNPEQEFQKRTKALSSDGMVEDSRPIAGIGDSLKDLEAKLKAIDDETSTTKNDSETSL